MMGLQKAGVIPSETSSASAVTDKTAFNLF
jgi:hypothetical protein